jgi:hypothetical protein
VKISRQQVLLVYGLGFLAAHSNKLFVLFFSMWSRRLATPLNSVKTNSEHAFIAEWFAEKS